MVEISEDEAINQGAWREYIRLRDGGYRTAWLAERLKRVVFACTD